MNNDTGDTEKTDEADVSSTRSTLPTFSEWIGFQLPSLPSMPQTVKNLDKAAAALLDWPTAVLEGKASRARSETEQSILLESAVIEAMRRELGNVDNKKLSSQVRGLVQDYLQKHHSRKRVLELAVKEVATDPGSDDATGKPSDDFMAFFKGKVDSLGTDEARMLFAKVLAGEVKRPGSFSKPAMSILAEMDEDVGSLFERLCNMSVALPAGIPIEFWKPRVLTLGMGNAGSNALRDFGLGFDQLNILNEAGLIISDYNSYNLLFGQIELAGRAHTLSVKPQPDMTAGKVAAEGVLQQMHGVAFTKAGGELRKIVSIAPYEPYVTRLRAEFEKFGVIMS